LGGVSVGGTIEFPPHDKPTTLARVGGGEKGTIAKGTAGGMQKNKMYVSVII
jgi:hypothetical protein